MNSLIKFAIGACFLYFMVSYITGNTGFPSPFQKSATVSKNAAATMTGSGAVQTPTSGSPFSHEAKGYRFALTPRADYTLEGTVIATLKYSSSGARDLQPVVSPIDVSMKWGDAGKYDPYVHYSLSGRFLTYWYADGGKIDKRYLETHVSNNHIVPASENVLAAVGGFRKGEYVRMEGELVDIKGEGQASFFTEKTSLTRDDSWDGACEVFYVKRVVIDGNVYE